MTGRKWLMMIVLVALLMVGAVGTQAQTPIALLNADLSTASYTNNFCYFTIRFTANTAATYELSIADDGDILQAENFVLGAGGSAQSLFILKIVPKTQIPSFGIFIRNLDSGKFVALVNVVNYNVGLDEQCRQTNGEFGQPSRGCEGIVIPANAVVGAMPFHTRAYWAPFKITPEVTVRAGTYWVVDRDPTGEFYQIILACQYLWVPSDSMGPNFDNVWRGRPIPNFRFDPATGGSNHPDL